MKVMSMSELAEVLQDMMGESNDTGKLTTPQVIGRLMNYKELVIDAELPTYRPGDLLIHKYPATSNIRGANHPVLFLRYLTKSIDGAEMVRRGCDPSNLTSAAAGKVFDCITVSFLKNSFCEFLSCSGEYKRFK